MSLKKRTSPQEWIHDYYGPVLTVYASEDAEMIASKNNLTFTELLQPFSKMGTDVTIKDVDGQNHNVASLNLILQDWKKDPNKNVSTKLMLDRISEENCDERDMITKHFDKVSLDAPGYTPWYDIWMKYYLQTLPVVEHEFIKHSLGCIFVVSTSSANPVETFRTLSANQARHQHDRAGSSYPVYFSPSILKYYVLVHDSYSSVEDTAAQEMFTQVQNAFDSVNCHFLPVNSSNGSPDQSEDSTGSGLTDHWLAFSHRWCSVETRRGKSFTSGMSTSPASPPGSGDVKEEASPLPHPLAQTAPPDSPAHLAPAPKLTHASTKNVASHLTANDIDRIRIFMREFVIKSLVPYVEKQLRLTAEIVTNRKSRSLFSGAKRWFGANKPAGSGAGTSVVYSREAPELQVRRIADLYFMMKLWKPAYNYYYIAKKDFHSDEAWPYYASAVECAALAMFMLSSTEPGKKYRPDYMEDSITKYLTLCQTPEFAVRATLFDGLCLKQQGMFTEAATSYIRMTNELSDLRSAMLLEQAAYCFLLSSPPSPRKYGFHIVLAGYRFTKTGGCKQHAARLYQQGSLLYSGSTWQLSTQHILYTLGHLKFMLKDYAAAADYFNCLIEGAVAGNLQLQQMVHLREYFLVHHARAKEDKAVPVITLPKLLSQDTEVRLSKDLDSPDLVTWQSLEKLVKETVTGQDIHTLSSSCQPVFNNETSNHLQPRAVTGETIFVRVKMENVFNTPLQIRKANLLWRFTPEDSEDSVMNDKKDAVTKDLVDTGILDTTVLEKNSVTDLTFHLTALVPGQLTLLGVEYSIKAMFPDKEPTDHEIRGKQMFSIAPPHVNTTAGRKNASGVGVDRRLELVVMRPLPRLEAEITVPESLCEGEMRCCELELRNTGPCDMTRVFLACQTPGLLSFGKRKETETRGLFEFPLIQDTSPQSQFRRKTEDGRVVQTSVDLMSVPLAGEVLTSGARAKVPVWVRGPEVSEVTEAGPHRLYLYYDTTMEPSKHTPRLLPVNLSIACQPSLQLSCERSGHLSHTNTPGRQLRLSVSNVSRDLSVSMETITIVQVSLVSRDEELCGLQSSVTACAVTRGHTTTSVITTARAAEIEAEWRDVAELTKLTPDKVIPGGALHLTSVTATTAAGYPVHSPPHTHFIKHFFAHNLGRRGNPPLLSGDLCLVLWRSAGSSPIIGQSVVRVSDAEEEDTVPEYPLSVRVEMEEGGLGEHDFSQAGSCSVRGRVMLEARDQGVMVQYGLREQIKGTRITGNIDGFVWLDKKSASELQFSVLVTRPGFYHLNNFQFRAKQTDICDKKCFDQTAEKFLQLDISFTVKQK